MEASQDPFGQAVSGTQEDPFAAADAEFQQGDDPFGEGEVTEQPRPGVPVVGADGEPKAATQEAATEETVEEAKEREAAEAAQRENDAEFDRVMTPAPEDPQPAPTDGGQTAQSAATTEQSEGGSAPSAEGADPTPAPVSETPGASPAAADASAPAAQTSPTPASATESGDGNGSAESDAGEQKPTVHPDNDAAEAERAAAAADEVEAEERQPETNKKGETVRRPYMIFVPEGKGRWREVTWWENSDGKMVPQGTQGATKQKTCVVRGQEEALRIGYRALGSPPEGIGIVAVAANYFRLRQVEPDVEPQPRQRLKIR